jgi:ABC-type branched-subunit amino acid transport system ATPase component
MLSISQLETGYDLTVLFDVSLEVEGGEICAIFGPNGAGKTTLLRCITGAHRIRAGWISLDGRRIDNLSSHEIGRLGIGYVAQARGLFPGLTVDENLTVGKGPLNAKVLEEVREMWPLLKYRGHQAAATLSGGEQQLLKLACALSRATRVLLLDEPTQGLQQSALSDLSQLVRRYAREQSIAVILVEQNRLFGSHIADKVIVLDRGTVIGGTAVRRFDSTRSENTTISP